MRPSFAGVVFFVTAALAAQEPPPVSPLTALHDAILASEVRALRIYGKSAGLELTFTGLGVMGGLPTCLRQAKSATFKNNTSTPVRVHEVVLASLPHGLAGATAVYGEGFQMLSQTAGTLASPIDLEPYTDRGHYRLPEPAGLRSVYGMLLLSDPQQSLLLGFMTCKRFVGRIDFNKERLQIVLDCEDVEVAPGGTLELEPLWLALGADRNELLDGLAEDVAKNNAVQLPPEPPAGWCSWYCFGPQVTAADVARNLDVLAKELPQLRYVQIDDGYQPHMGDWLETGAAFGGDVKAVLRAIRDRGFVPAIWVAPFIADAQSRLFAEHPGWFVQGPDGKPLRSDTVGFGGWRMAPWYCLDGTHPEVQQHFETLFRTLREDWGCGYFKLDANYWGAIRGGRFHDPNATRIEAYRRGMAAIRRGAGDAFVLGCNHPLWPSLGLVDGSRSSMDVDRSWEAFARTGRENLLRSWQNGKLWWNDPDCLLVAEPLPEGEVSFHASLLLATGGLLLSGDDLGRLSEARRALLRRALQQRGVAARFDAALQHGVIDRGGGRELHVFLRWDEGPWSAGLELAKPHRLVDFWSGQDLGVHEGHYAVELPPRCGRVIAVEPAR
ncbi:MAG: alpha-galactosidase [Planctomycetes bacterium]|nr:alpha-galactosidase [Planctomycetota bacterium]